MIKCNLLGYMFRIWDTKKGIFVRNVDVSGNTKIYFSFAGVGNILNQEDYPACLKRFLISWATGMHDCNGNMIFVGDILEDFDKAKIVVSYDSDKGMVMGIKEDGTSRPLQDGWYDERHFVWNYKIPEIIGNIWEDADILSIKVLVEWACRQS